MITLKETCCAKLYSLFVFVFLTMYQILSSTMNNTSLSSIKVAPQNDILVKHPSLKLDLYFDLSRELLFQLGTLLLAVLTALHPQPQLEAERTIREGPEMKSKLYTIPLFLTSSSFE